MTIDADQPTQGKLKMQLKWNGEIGPATVVTAFGTLSILVAIGSAYGNQQSDIKTAQAIALEAKQVAVKLNESFSERDRRINESFERMGRVETSIAFIVPSLERIEIRLNSIKLTQNNR